MPGMLRYPAYSAERQYFRGLYDGLYSQLDGDASEHLVSVEVAWDQRLCGVLFLSFELGLNQALSIAGEVEKNAPVLYNRENETHRRVRHMIKLQVKKLRPGAVLPTRGSAQAAGYDLYACLEHSVSIAPHGTAMIGTGLSIAVPEGYFGAIFARSGLASKQGLRPANCVGVCDSDYRGEYIIPLHNDGDTERTVNDGERIAQLIVMPYLAVDFEEVSELPDTERGAAGFGSTGF